MLKRDLATLQDVGNLKKWLKSYRISRQPDFEEEMLARMDFDAFFK